MARTVATTTYHVPGDLVSGLTWNSGPKALNDFLSNRPAFRGISQVAITVATSTWVAVPIALTYIDTDGGHNNVTNNTRYTCQVAGWYWVKGTVAWYTGVSTSTSRVDTVIARNGSFIAGSGQFLSYNGSASLLQALVNASALVQLAVGDYVEIYGRQWTGSNQLYDQGSQRGFCELSALWVHA